MDKRFAQALLHAEQACQRLNEVLAMPEDDIVRDALIKRFEFSFEAGWKAAYRWMRARGVDVDEGAYEVIPAAFKRRLITDAQGWDDMRKMRNRTAHTYDLSMALLVAAFARGDGQRLLADLLNTLKARADE